MTGWKKFGVVSMFLAPSLIALLAFSIGPMFGTLWVSVQEWNLIRPAEFIGADNYRELWSDDDFRRALLNTLYY
ncbi:MAG: sugar ABC transporter permease, partial [Ilumatobacter fluminis]